MVGDVRQEWPDLPEIPENETFRWHWKHGGKWSGDRYHGWMWGVDGIDDLIGMEP
jgi:hypothetical protein